MKKFLHFTHTDSDGLGCALVFAMYLNNISGREGKNPFVFQPNALDEVMSTDMTQQIFFKATGIKVSSCIMENVGIILSNMSDDDDDLYVLISDVGITDECAEYLDSIESPDFHVLLVDHHPTNTLGIRYVWCDVAYNEYTSAALYLYNMIHDDSRLIFNNSGILPPVNPMSLMLTDNFKTLITNISHYDTWYWKKVSTPNKYWNNLAEDFATNCISCYSITVTFNYFYTVYTKPDSSESEEYITKLYAADTITKVLHEKNYNFTINNVRYLTIDENDFFTPEFIGKNTAVIMAENSDGNFIADKILSSYQFVDFVIILYPSTARLSFRGSIIRDNGVHLGELTKTKFNGGGHKTAAGGSLPYDEFLKFMKYVYYDAGKLLE